MAYEASEIMTAVALQSNVSSLSKVKTQADLQKLIKDGIKIVDKGKDIQFGDDKTLKGFSAKLNPQAPASIKDMAVGVSAALAIRGYMGKMSGALTVYMTGNIFPKDVEDFKVSAFGFQDYNSSDIIVSADKKKFFGVSLKKKKDVKAADPTLINKPITGSKSLLKDFISEQDMNTIERAKNLFFIRMVAAYKNTTNYNSIRKLSEKEFKKEIAKIPNDFANDMLAGRGAMGRKNIFWQSVNKVLMKDSKEMMTAFLKLIFKVDLQPILDESGQFDFYLLTGIGQRKGDKIGVEPAEVKDLPTTIEALSKIFKQDKIKLGKTVDNKGNVRRQPWEYEKGEKAPAKLFYTIYNGSIPLLNLEIRYKGSKTAEPQFQATATPIFKNMMSGKK